MSEKNDSLEEKLQRLDELIAWFSSDEFTLDMAFDKHAAAEKLAHDIEEQLAAMTNKVTVLKQKFDT